jgi:hypothetical protein
VLVAHTCNLATQEAEIRRIAVQSQLWQIVRETLSQKKKKITKKGWWSGSRSQKKKKITKKGWLSGSR